MKKRVLDQLTKGWNIRLTSVNPEGFDGVKGGEGCGGVKEAVS